MGARTGGGAPPAGVRVGGTDTAVPAGVPSPCQSQGCGALAAPLPRPRWPSGWESRRVLPSAAHILEGLGLVSLGSCAGDFNRQAA